MCINEIGQMGYVHPLRTKYENVFRNILYLFTFPLVWNK